MTISVDEAGVKVDLEGWQALLLGEGAPDDVLARAHAAPGTREALAAARNPVALLEVQTRTPHGPRAHLGWICEASVALLVDLGDEDHRVMSFAPDQLPGALARLIGLGPRWTRDPQTLELDAEELHETLTGTSATLLDRADADRAWSLTCGPVEGGEDASLLAAGLDGPGGSWLVVPGGEDLTAERVPPRQVWRLLTSLLPALPPPSASPS